MQAAPWWRGWLSLGLVIAAGGMIPNALWGRFPLYYYRGDDPLLAIPLGMVAETAVWIILTAVIGGLTELIRRVFKGGISWHPGIRLWAMLCLEIYVVKSIFDISMRDGLFRYFEVYWLDDEPRIIGLILISLLVAVSYIFARRRSPSRTIRKDEVKILFFFFFLMVVYGYVYNRWMSTTNWPLPGVLPGIALIAGAVFGIAVWTYQHRWAILKTAVFLILLALPAMAVLTLWYSFPSGVEKDNIIVSIWDAARSSRMSLYDYQKETTPGLEKISSRSVIFKNHFSTSNYTYPGHISLFTGKNYREHNYHIGNCEEYERYRSEDVLADRLSREGYHTVLFTENPWVLMADKGFDEVRYFPIMGMYASGKNKRECEVGYPVKIIKYFNPFLGRRLVDTVIYRFDGFYSYTIDRIILRHIQKLFIKKRRLGPIFLCWNMMNVHNRYHPFTDWEHGAIVEDYDFPEEYDRAMLRADQRFKELYELLDKWGQRDRSVLIVTADHGEFLGEDGLWGHHQGLFEPVLRVPLIVINDRLSRYRETAPVSITSLRPFIEAVAAGNISLGSEDLANCLAKAEPVIAEHGYLPDDRSRKYSWSYTVIDDEYQYVNDPLLYSYESDLPSGKTALLFKNTKRDTIEDDIFSAEPSRAEDLNHLYSRYLRRLNAEAKSSAKPVAKIDQEKKLRALGYIE